MVLAACRVFLNKTQFLIGVFRTAACPNFLRFSREKREGRSARKKDYCMTQKGDLPVIFACSFLVGLNYLGIRGGY